MDTAKTERKIKRERDREEKEQKEDKYFQYTICRERCFELLSSKLLSCKSNELRQRINVAYYCMLTHIEATLEKLEAAHTLAGAPAHPRCDSGVTIVLTQTKC
jgi:hypothetical protein